MPNERKMSTLDRAAEIELQFYNLKAQEWACEPYEAEKAIKAALNPVRDWFIAVRSDDAQFS